MFTFPVGANWRQQSSNLILSLDSGNTSSYPGSGTTWTDLATAKTATLINGVGYSSSNGGILTFDGGNDYANIPTSTDFDLGDTYTIETWINPSNITTNFGIVHRGFYNTIGQSWSELAFSLRSLGSGTPGLVRAYFYGLNAATEQRLDGTALVLNTWQQLIVVRNGTTGEFYRNNVLLNSVSGLNVPAASTRPLRIGLWDYDTANEFFPGRLSIIRIYKGKALNSTERQQNFDEFRGRYGI